MKTTALSVLFGFVTACAGSASKTPAVATQEAALTSADSRKPAETAPEEAAVNMAERGPLPGAQPMAPATPESVDGLDPIARYGTSNLPKIELTPKKDLKKKTRRDLDAALAAGQAAKDVDAAVAAMIQKAGKPTWIEGEGKKRVWVVVDGARCHRLTLDHAGEIDLEVSSTTEWHMLSVGARQNVCSGEVRAGIVGGE